MCEFFVGNQHARSGENDHSFAKTLQNNENIRKAISVTNLEKNSG